MIHKRAYDAGVEAAWLTFTKTSMPSPITMPRPTTKPAAVHMFNAGGGVGNAHPVAPPVQAGTAVASPKAMAGPQMPAGNGDATKASVPPIMGGAAAPAPAAAPAAGGGWKGLAKDVGIQAAVPLAMMGVQNLMTPSGPKDPNAP